MNPLLDLSKVSMSGYLVDGFEGSSMNGLFEYWALYIVVEGRIVGIRQRIRTVRTVMFMRQIKGRDRKQISREAQ